MTGTRIVAASLFAVSVGVSTVPMWPIFETPQLIIAIAVSMLVGAGIAVASAVRRWSVLTTTLVSLLALCVLAVPLAAPARMHGILPTADAIGVVARAVVLSWRRLLTIVPPVGDADGLLVAPVILVVVTMVVGVTIVLRTRRAELAALLPGVVFVWGILWGTSEAFVPILAGLALAMATTGFVTVVRQARRRRSAPRTLSSLWRRVLAGVAAASIAVGAGWAAGIVLPIEERTVLRHAQAPPLAPELFTSPLAEFRSYLQPGMRDEPLFTATGLEGGARVRLATLDDYDGQVFRIADREGFARVSGGVAQAGQAHVGITIQSLESTWVPIVGTPSAVSFVGERALALQESLHENASTGDRLVVAGLRASDGYQLVTDTSRSTPDLRELEPGALPRSFPALPDAALERLVAWTSRASTPGQRLDALIAGIQADGYVSHGIDETEPASRAGHSLLRIEQLFDGTMIGDAEQYAVLAALLASKLGFPARVVMGFTPDVTPGMPTTVVGSDVDAWIEVRATEGWVPITTTPPDRHVPEDEASQPRSVTQPDPPGGPNLPAAGQESESEPAPGVEPAPQPTRSSAIGAVLAWVAGILGILVLVALPFAAILLVKALRRRRRRHADAASTRALGAWRELVDARVDRGAAPQGRRTRLEYAGEDASLRSLANEIDRIVFSRGAAEEAAVESAWERSAALVRAHDANARRIDRVRARLSLRSLRAGEP